MPRLRSEERIYIPAQIRTAVLNESGRICAHCGETLTYPRRFTIEHVIPLHKGGTNDKVNLVALCEECNKAKSDDIIEPQSYYKYLPAERIEELQTLFQEYLHNTKWLAYDTVFKTDQFELYPAVTIVSKQGRGQPVSVPIRVQVSKLRKQDAAEWLMLYTGRLATKDKELIMYEKDKLVLPYYKITKGDKTIAVVAPYLHKGDFNTPLSPKKDHTILIMDIFGQPDIRTNFTTTELIGKCLLGLINKAQETLILHAKGSAVELLVRTPESDRVMAASFKNLTDHTGHIFSMLRLAEGDPETMPCMICLNGIVFQGSRKESLEAFPDRQPDGTVSNDAIDLTEFQMELAQELNKSKTVSTQTPKKKKPTKSDKKKAHKKPHRHNR